MKTKHVSALAFVALALCNCSSESLPQSDEVVSDSESDISQSFTGNVSASGTSWVTHTVTVTGAGTLSINLNWVNASANLNVFLNGPTGAAIAHQNGTAKPEVLSVEITQPGTYTIGIKCKTGATAYTLTTDFQPAAHAYPGRPAAGTIYWGAAISSNGDPVTRHENAAGHPLTLHRTFHQWNQRTTRLVEEATDDAAHGRVGWVSVKTPPWDEMGDGDHDAEIDQMLNALDDIDGPVWLTMHHEPEGGGGTNAPDDPSGPAGHIAMNTRVRQRMTALGVDNVALAPILMTYTWKPGSGRNPEDWWAPGIYDFLGVDHYRDSETSPLDDAWYDIREFAAAKGVEVAVGEWGMRGTDTAAGNRMKAFYDHAAGSHQDGLGGRVVGLSYFDSGANSPSGSWELAGAQLTMFRTLLGDPRTAQP
jgi:hypothetical protein